MLRIKEITRQKGLNQSILAEKLGISKVALSNSINGNPTLETLQKIANVLGVHITDLFEPNTDDFNTLYIQNDDGEMIEIGQVRKDKE